MTTTDIVVIGGGILGASTAYQLARAGHRVTVLERGAPNREGSGTTAGNLHIQGIHTRRPGQAVAADNLRFLPLQRTASTLWSQLPDELDADLELTRNGGFMVAETPEQVQELHQKFDLETQLGLTCEIVSGDEARRRMPALSETVIAAEWCAEDGYANPLLVTPAYLGAARRYGAQVEAFSPVTGIEHDGGAYVVRSGHREWSAGVVIDTAGPWIADVAALAGIRLDMSPVAIQMHITTRMPLGTLTCLVQHIGAGMSVKQVGAGNILIGGGWPAEAFRAHGRSRVATDSISGNLHQAAAVLPLLRDLRLLRTWAGPLAATPDEMPVIGEVPSSPGFFVAGGTYAFTLAPLWGLVLRDLVEGNSPLEPVADLGVDRLVLDAVAHQR
ncbi:NAD(P)/FAD-dependent oxidoreductase [Occultella gossypii]|uniref:FAD-binding oxidoreductase n=1 Tax=Occultella gossypii TaxID=2800820 RepID=A0ABS7S540_9MICO|nr:FAD-binding oxidoreductase [Occultella gossypii]MBZ2195466.1 FAD-binding oxidoreductase [Occultella gossypii]